MVKIRDQIRPGSKSHPVLNMTRAGLVHLERHSFASIMCAVTGSSLWAFYIAEKIIW